MRSFTIKIVVFVLSIASVGFCSQASSAPFSCNARLGTVLVYADGSVNVLHSGRGDYTYVCNLNTPWKGVTVQTCAMWTSLLLKLKGEGKNAIFFYYGGDGASCANMDVYSNAPAPTYIGVIDDVASTSSKIAKLPVVPPQP